jgi:hypothetical protein
MARPNKMKEAGWSRKAKSVWLRDAANLMFLANSEPKWVGFHVIAVEVDFKGKACNPAWQSPIDTWRKLNTGKSPQLVKLPNGRMAFIYLENYSNA